MNRVLSAIIVDDEPLACEGLKIRLNSDPRITVLAECPNAAVAMAQISQHRPDVVFVDIEMPGMSGLELARHITTTCHTQTKIVFVTAYREYAINAFDFKAFDYLLKPFSQARLNQCIDELCLALADCEVLQQHKKLGELLNRKTGNSIDALMHNLQQSGQGSLQDLQQTISLKNGSEWLRVKLDNISWIEAAGDYMCVHTLEGTHIIRKTLKQFEQELDARRFPRVNRSAMLNISKLTKLTPNSNGEYIAQLSNGDTVKVSRKYKCRLDELKKSD